MKCSNCGLELNGKFCSECGTVAPVENINNNQDYINQNNQTNYSGNPYINPIPPQHQNNFQSQNIPTQATQNFGQTMHNNPYAQPNPVNPSFAQQGQVNPTQNMSYANQPLQQSNAVQNRFNGVSAPAPNPYSANANLTAENQNNKKSSSKVLPIILLSLVLVVILAGIGIAVYSSIFHNYSLFENIVNETSGAVNNFIS